MTKILKNIKLTPQKYVSTKKHNLSTNKEEIEVIPSNWIYLTKDMGMTSKLERGASKMSLIPHDGIEGLHTQDLLEGSIHLQQN